jgi:sugar lactone lactonase YvrE
MTMIDRSSRALLSAFALLATGAPAHAAPPVAPDIRIADRDVFPESLSADRMGRLYVGSAKGIVFRTAPRGNVAQPWIRPDTANGILSILGVLVDERSRTLWICSSPMPFRQPPVTGVSAVIAFDLHNGRLKGRYPFPAPAASACNDITIATDGTLYASDTPNGRIFSLRPGAKELTLFAQDDRLKGIDGIAFSGTGTLYANNVQANAMLRVDRRSDGAFAGVTPLVLSQPVGAPDGLRLIDGNRFLQAEGGSGRITEVRIDGDRADITVLRDGLDSSPGVTPGRGRVYAVEGKIRYLIDPKLKGQDPNPFLIRAIPLPPR